VSKHDFDMAVKNAQEALRAKTSSSQAMLQQASSAMRNAVTALSLSEQEVANLRQSVQELKQQRDAAGVSGEAGPATDRERAQLRAAQARLAELSQNFRALQSEVARHRYEQDGTAMPVASSFPLRIDPMLSSKVVCIAQLVMLGYSYGDAENALDAVRVNDTVLALEWLEARNVVKISLVSEADAAAFKSAFANTNANSASHAAQLASASDFTREKTKTSTLYKETETTETTRIVTKQSSMRGVDLSLSRVERDASTTGGVSSNEKRKDFRAGTVTARGFDANELYAARKRSVMMLAMLAVNPPPTLSKNKQEAMAFGALRALANLANGDSAYMVMMLGGVRCGVECLKLYPGDRTCAVAAFDVFRGIANNPSTLAKLRKQQRFKLLPKTVVDAVRECLAPAANEALSRARIVGDMDVVGAAAHALWAMASIGGSDQQDKIVSAGALDFIKEALSKPKSADPNGENVRKLIGCLLALATRNVRLQDVFVENGARALIRKGLVEHSHISFKGEFASLREWTKAEFANPTPLPRGVVVDAAAATSSTSKQQSMVKTASKESRYDAYNATTTTTIVRETVEEGDEDGRLVVAGGGRGERTTNVVKKIAKKKGFTNEQMYAARKRAIVMMTAVSVNPPGKITGMTREMSEDIAHRCLVGLARLALGDSAFLVLTNGGPRAAIDCLRLYPTNERVVRAAFRVTRGLLQNPSTMMKFRKQKRFRVLPRVVADATSKFENNVDVKAEAAHALWTYSGVGGPDAQEAVLGVGFLDVIKSGLEQARVADKRDGKDSRVRKFVGCALALAVGNENAQDLLVREGLRSLVRKSLVEFAAISFHGEFAELRDWIRGDRGGARSAGKSSTAREKALAENTLSRDATETGARTHAEAQRMQSGVDTPPDYRPATAPTTSQTTSQHTSRVVSGSLSTTTRQGASHAETSLVEEREAFAGVERVTRKMSSSGQTHVVKEKASATYVSNANKSALRDDTSDASAYTVDRALRTLESDTRESHPEACEALAEMFAASPAVGVEVVMKGGVRAIGAAIAGGSSAFVAGAFALLHMFATADITSRRVLADERVVAGETCAVILGAMRRYNRNAAVQQWGGMVLWALAKDNERCKSSTLNARVPGGRGTAAEILTNALRLHGTKDENESVAKALAGAVMTFASNSREWQEALAEVDAPAVVMAALDRHAGLTFKGEFDGLRSWLRQNS
jgi:hypothetical protein